MAVIAGSKRLCLSIITFLVAKVVSGSYFLTSVKVNKNCHFYGSRENAESVHKNLWFTAVNSIKVDKSQRPVF